MALESTLARRRYRPTDWRDRFVFQSLSFLASILSWMPVKLVTICCRLLSYLGFDCLRLRRRLLLKNLRIAFPEGIPGQNYKTLARESVFQFLLTVFEVLRSRRYPLATKVEFIGVEHIQAALAEGRGVYILGCHLGNWEALGAAVNQHIGPCYITVKKVGGPGVNAFVESLRTRNGFRWLQRDQDGDAVRQIKEVLGRGEMVGFVYDQARPGEPRLPFFSATAKTNTSLMALWHRRPAPIVPVWIHRQSFGVQRVVFRPPVPLQRTKPASDSILRGSQQLNQELELMIRQAPQQYFWLHNRWK